MVHPRGRANPIIDNVWHTHYSSTAACITRTHYRSAQITRQQGIEEEESCGENLHSALSRCSYLATLKRGRNDFVIILHVDSPSSLPKKR